MKKVVHAIVKYKDKILLLKRAKTMKTSPGMWQPVSGIIKFLESPEKTAIREVKEETGLNGTITAKGDWFEFMDDYGEWKVKPFIVDVTSDKVKLSKEHTEYKWITRKEIKKYKTPGYHADFLILGLEVPKETNKSKK